jgi:hypothetical protein
MKNDVNSNKSSKPRLITQICDSRNPRPDLYVQRSLIPNQNNFKR